MSECVLSKMLMIIIYLIIIILIPIFLYYLFKLTVDNRKKEEIYNLAKQKSIQIGKPLIVFNDRSNGLVINPEDKSSENFEGDIIDIIDQMADNSGVILLLNVLEYIDDESIKILVEQLKNVSGGNLYSTNIGKNSPLTILDYKIINIMDKSYYLPEDSIAWSKPNQFQKILQKFYSVVFKILPDKWIFNRSIQE